MDPSKSVWRRNNPARAGTARGKAYFYATPARLLLLTLAMLTSLIDASRASSHSSALAAKPGHGSGDYDPGGKVLTVIRMDDEKFIQLWQRWNEQAYASIFAALANKRLPTASNHTRDDFLRCSKKSKNVPEQARCLSKLIAVTEHHQAQRQRLKAECKPRRKHQRISAGDDGKNRRESRRTKREIPSITAKFDGLGPLGMVAKLISGFSQLAKKDGGATDVPWQTTVEKIRRFKESRSNNPSFGADHSAPKTMDDFLSFLRLRKKPVQPSSLQEPYRLRDDSSPPHPESALGSDASSSVVSFIRQGLKLGMAVANSSSANDGKKRAISVLSPRFLSLVPEDENNEDGENDVEASTGKATPINLLSPSVFSMHNESRGIEGALSLPRLMSGFNKRDRHAWLNLIMQASGAADQMNRVEKMMEISDANSKGDMGADGSSKDKSIAIPKELASLVDGLGPELLLDCKVDKHVPDLTRLYDPEHEKRKGEVIGRVIASYSRRQKRELRLDGYTHMSGHQLRMLYGKDSPYANPVALQKLGKLTSRGKEQVLSEVVREISKMALMQFDPPARKTGATSNWRRRVKRASPGYVSLILSPVIFAPRIASPLIALSVILSPRLFAPIILSPVAFGDNILAPNGFVPLILSPFLFRPGILSPAMFSPVILSPLNMAPNILSPQLFSPLILSPLLFGPLILNPLMASPLILTPRLLSPIIYSYRLLYALIISPYALTPSIESPTPYMVRVLSPSWLS